MKCKMIVLSIAATAAFYGCSGDDDSSSGFNRELTYKISAENTTQVTKASYNNAMFNTIESISSNLSSSFRVTPSTRLAGQLRATEKGKDSCEDSGSVSATVTVSDDKNIVTADLDFDNCTQTGANLDGGMAFTIEYPSSSDTDKAKSQAFEFKNLFISNESTSDTPSTYVTMDGKLNASNNPDDSTSSRNWNYYIHSLDLGKKTFYTYTTTALSYDSAGTLTAGAWTVEGSDDTKLTVVVEGGSLTVTANGGQPETISISEL